ncbi:MAG: transcriptional regulator [Alphaproteobacteria bacterium]|nr:MAG: transcriptional regulator [Alphaproteobacteria bacterium]
MNENQTTYSAVLGVILSNLRKENGLEQGEMAGRMGLSQASYSRLEGGKSAFSVDQMYQAAIALGMNEDDITNRTNNTVSELRANDVEVLPQVRANTYQGKSELTPVGSFVVGAALGALLIGLLSKR